MLGEARCGGFFHCRHSAQAFSSIQQCLRREQTNSIFGTSSQGSLSAACISSASAYLAGFSHGPQRKSGP